MTKPFPAALCIFGLLAFGVSTHAGPPEGADVAQRLEVLESRIHQLEAENQQMQGQVIRLQAEHSDAWLNERRADEVKALVREVLADADTRASLLDAGVTAGHNGKNFFLASADGTFLMQIDGQIVTRYIYNNVDSTKSPGDDDEGGFQLRSTKLGFAGHVIDPSWQYKVKAGFDRTTGTFVLEEAYINKRLDGKVVKYIRAGQFKSPFLREENIADPRQLTAERSNVNESFTLDYSQGVQIGAQYDKWNWALLVHDGREADNVEYSADATDFAGAARLEYKLAGDWKQFDDFVAWSKDPFGVLLGAAIDYEQGESGRNSTTDWTRMIQYTADISVERYPFSGFAAIVGRHIDFDAGAANLGPPPAGTPVFLYSDTTANQWGTVVQGSVFVIPDKMDLFARYEYLDFDDTSELTGIANVAGLGVANVRDTQQIITVGGNYYFHRHDAKLTIDLLWAPDGVRIGESLTGTVASNGDEQDQFVLRTQLQLLF